MENRFIHRLQERQEDQLDGFGHDYAARCDAALHSVELVRDFSQGKMQASGVRLALVPLTDASDGVFLSRAEKILPKAVMLRVRGVGALKKYDVMAVRVPRVDRDARYLKLRNGKAGTLVLA